MSSFNEVRSNLLKKYNVSAAGSTGSNQQSGNTTQTVDTDFYTIRSKLLDKYSPDKVEDRQSAVSSWAERFDNAMQGISNSNSKSGNWYTRSAIDSFGQEIDSLIRDYDSIKDYAARLGIPNSQRYLKQLLEVQSQFQKENEWYEKYKGSGHNEVETALSAMVAGDERSWLEDNRYKVAPDYEELYKLGLSNYRQDAKKTMEYADSYEGKLQNWINQMAEAPVQDANPQYYQMLQQYRNDTSYKEMDDRWSEEQRRDFGYLYAQDKQKAEEYAIALNEQLNAQEKDKQRQAVQEKATSGVKSGLKETGKAIAAGMLGIGEYMNDVAEYAARGRITEKGDSLSPVEYSNAVTGGISQHLNEKYGTIDDDVFILGGKGLGDVYSLGTSVAQSMAAGHLLGGTGTLISYFGSAAASGIDDAKRRGATDEQAIVLGTLQGVAEGLAEKIGVDNLFKRGAANTIRGFLKNVFSQAGSEGIEEGLTSLFNNISENIVMGENSQFYDRVNGYLENGMEEGTAKKQAWLDCVEDILFDSIAGAASGGISGGIETGIQTGLQKMYGDPLESKMEENDSKGTENALAMADSNIDDRIDVPGAQESSAADDKMSATENASPTLESLSEKYGDRAADMRKTYMEGQDVEEYDRAFQMAYDMGKAGVSESYAQKSEATAYLSETQRSIAYNMGALDAQSAASALAAKNAAAVNGKTGWHKGTVKGQGVKIADMSKAFNDPQRKAYKYLSGIAEVTGVDIVLYKSEADADGNYQGAQGKFKASENTIYIDINAGLSKQKKANTPEDLAKYTMMRTYTHEFTHFVEKWNPEEYNGFRKTVFDAMTDNGENVDDLITAVQNSRGMNYDQASREVIAEAMTDILPETSFLEQLAQKNQNVFQQLLSKLKEFLTSIKQHFASMGDSSREAKALKRQMGETVSYMEEIVKKFDEVAVKAVENYQRTVAEDATVSKKEKVSDTTTEETVTETEETVTTTEESVIETEDTVSEVRKVASEDASLDASPAPETELHQARKTGNEPTTAREWSVFNRSFANKTSGMAAGQEKKIIIWTADHAYLVNATGYMEGDIAQKIKIDGNEYKLEKLIKEFEHGTDRSRETADTWAEAVRRRAGRRAGNYAAAEYRADAGRNDAVDDGEPAGNDQRPYWESDGYSSYEELIEAVESGALIPDENGDPIELHQERTETLTGRDALDYASQPGNGLELTEGEQLALKAFQKRLNELQRLQEQRSDLGKQWRTQAFGDDRKPAEARKTLDKMRELDKEIKAATEKLLSLEDAPGLNQVIKKSKAAIERQEKARVREELKQYRNKQNNAVLRKKIRKTVKALDSLLKSETKEKHVPDSMKKAVADALSLMNELDLGVAEKRIEAAKASARELEQKLAQAEGFADSSLIADLQAQLDEKQLALERYEKSGSRLTALKDAYEDIRNSTDPDVAAGYDADVAGALKELAETIKDTAFQDMSREQLQDVLDMYTMVLTRIRDANKQLGARRGETLRENAAETEADIRKFGISEKDPGVIADKIGKIVRSFSWKNLRPVDAFHRLGSRKLEQLYIDLVDGMAQRGKQIKEIGQFITDIRKKTGYKSFDLKEAETYTTVDGTEMKLTLAEKMSIYAYSKREQAFDHMTQGGFTFANDQAYKEKSRTKIRKETADTWRLTLEDLQAICGSLTEQQRQYVDAVQQFLSEFGKYGDKVNMELYGIKLFNKERFYFPLKSDRDYRRSVETQLGGTMTAASLKNDGMTKKTVPGANNPIVLEDFDRVVFTHLDKMVNYANLVLPLENLRRVFDYQTAASENEDPTSMKKLIGATFGEEAQQYVEQFLTDANGTRMGVSINPLETMFARSKGMAVAANLSVSIQQISAVVRAAAEISPHHLLWAAENRKGVKLYDEMVEYAPIAVIKDMGGFDAGSNRSIEEYIGFEEAPNSAKKAWNSMQKLFGKGAETMDKVGWCLIWNGVKREVASRNQYKVNSEKFLQECGKRFTEVIVKTQVYDSVLSRSGFMRDKHGTMRYLTSFMGEPTVQAGMVFTSHLDVVRAIQFKNKNDLKYSIKKLARTDAVLVSALLVNGMLKAIPYAMRDDDEDEGYWERWAKHFGSAVSELWKPWELLPILRNMDDIWKGYSVTQPDMALLEGLLQAGKRVYDVMQDEEKLGEMAAEDYYALAKDLLGSLGSFFGVPVENIWRDLEGVTRAFKDMTDGIDSDGMLLDALRRGVKGEEKTKHEGIYDAMVSGDTARLDALKATYKTDSSYESAVRKALRLHDPRIKEMANARYEDDYDRLEALSYEIEAEDVFDMATIRAAYEAERTAQAKERGITLEEDSAAEQAEESTVFSMEEYYTAIRGGSEDSIQTAYNALIEEKKQQDYLEHEAEDSIANSVTSKVKGEYLDEDISREDAKTILTKYGGKSNSKAETEIKKWEFQMEYHYAWGSRDRCYRSGTISRSELVSAVMDIEGASRAEAQKYVDFLELEMKNENVDITASEASSWFEHAEPYGISMEVYQDYKARTNGIENDIGADGKPVKYTAVQKKMRIIHSLPLSSYQKDALARSNGWADSTIQKYKLW